MSDQGPGMETTAAGESASHFPLDELFAGRRARELAPRIGRFSILHKLGHGGMGVVYLGYDARLDRRAAVKLLRYEGEGEAGRARLLREAQALARLSHPNVVPIYECGEHGEDAYIAMEYVAGQTLRDWLRSERRTVAQILEVFVCAGRGLEAAHAAGLTHRDFKPENVMVGEDGRARVMDFGLVRTIEDVRSDASKEAATTQENLDVELTATGALLGTPAYMAPEQYRGGHVGPHTDQYSFCVALWEALHGNRPFAGKSLVELSTNILDGRIITPDAESKVPARVRKALERGMAVAPEQRWPSLGALLTVLEHELLVVRRRLVTVVAFAALAMVVAAAGLAWQKAVALRAMEAENRLATAEALALESSQLLDAGDAIDALVVAIEAAGALADESGVIPAKLPSQVNRSLYEAGKAELSWGVVAAHPGNASAVKFSPDGGYLAIAKHDRVWGISRDVIEIHDRKDGQVVAELSGHGCYLDDMEFFAEGSRLLTHCTDDGPAHLWDVSGALIATYESHERPTVSPVGQRVARRAGDTVELIDVSGAAVATLRGHTGEPTALAFAPEAARLATVGPDGVRVWDTSSGESLAVIEREGVLGVTWFADGSGRLATVSSDQHVNVWISESGELLEDLAPGADANANVSPDDFHGLAVTSDGSRVAAYLGRDAWLWNPRSGELIEHVADHSISSLPDHHGVLWNGNYELLDFSPDGSRLAIHRHDGTLLLLDAGSGEVIEETDGLVLVNSFSPDGKYLAVEADDVDIWDAQTGARLKSLRGSKLSHIAEFSPDGRFLVTLGLDADGEWQVLVWDSARQLSSTSAIFGSASIPAAVLAVGPNDGRIVRADTDRPRAWTAASVPVAGEVDGVRLAAFSHGGRALASIDREQSLRVWDARSNELIGGPYEIEYRVEALAVSDDGSHVALAHGDAVEVRDAKTNEKIIDLGEHDNSVSGVAFSANGQLLATIDNWHLRIWAIPSGKLMHELDGLGRTVAFSPDGTRIGTNQALWDVRTGTRIAEFEHSESAFGTIAFSPDGTLISAAGKLWDAFTGAYLGALEGHVQFVQHQGFMAGKDRLLTASRDSIIVRDAVPPMAAACDRLRPYVTAYATVSSTCDAAAQAFTPERPHVPERVFAASADRRWVVQSLGVLLFLALVVIGKLPGRLEALCARLPRAKRFARPAYEVSIAALGVLAVFVLTAGQLYDKLGTYLVVLSLPLLGLLLRRAPQRWWLWLSVTTVTIAAAGVLVAPELLGELHDLTPTGAATLAALCQAFVHTDPHNVYSGFSAHGEAHRVLGHHWQSLGAFAGVVTFGLYGIHRLATRVAKRHGDRLGFASLDQRAAMPFVLFLLIGFGLVSGPVLNAVARQQERRADEYALERGAESHDCAANAVLQSHQAGLSAVRPGLASVIWHARQPALSERIERCVEG